MMNMEMSNLKELFEKYKKIIRFGIVGCINTLVDFAVFTLALNVFGLDKLICQVFGYSIGVANSFVMNKLWTFEGQQVQSKTTSQLARFIVINLISLAASVVCLKIASDLFFINIYLAKVITIAVTQAINYLGYKLWVFK